MLSFSVHQSLRLNFQLESLLVTLLDKLVRHQSGGSLLHMPLFCGRRQVGRRHQHRHQQVPLRVLVPTVLFGFDQAEKLVPQPETIGYIRRFE